MERAQNQSCCSGVCTYCCNVDKWWWGWGWGGGGGGDDDDNGDGDRKIQCKLW